MKTWMSVWLFGRRPRIASLGARDRRRLGQATPRVDYLEDRCLLSADLAGGNFPEIYGRLPLRFEANLGQTDAQVRYLARGAGYALFLTPSEAVLRLHGPAAVGDAVLGVRLLGANPTPAIVGLNPLPGRDNYLIGNDSRNWRGDVATYSRVAYHGVYPGIDLVYYGNQSQLEYDFVVAPGADPSAIQLGVEGARSVTTNAAGDLVLHTAAGDVVEHAPVLYQEEAGIRQPVSGRFVLEGGGRVGFQVDAFDHAHALVIDPVLNYGTYLGGSGQDGGTGIAVDAAGNAYVTGYTASPNFPATPDADQTTNQGGSDVFVAKLNAAGTQLVYATYLGGSGQDGGTGIAVDAAGNAYVTGYTASANFPVTPGAFQTTQHGSLDAFVAKLNAAGTQLVYATYLGGSDGTEAMGIAVDAAGNAYVTGQTSSADFPVTPGASQTTRSGIQNGFVAELNTAGTQLVYATYLGGSGSDGGAGIAVDTAGNAYVTGYTDSTNFPVTSGAFQTSNHGGDDAFVAKVNPTGTALVYATYLGGLANEEGTAIAVDAAGNAYVTGATDSPNFPTTLGAFQTRSHGGGDAFVAKLNAAGAQLVYATYLGGSGRDGGTGITVDAAGNTYITGSTSSLDFPTTPGAFQTERHGSADAFVAKLNAADTQLAYATYLGGTGTNLGTAVAVDATGNAYVTGSTDATNFPVTSGAFQTSNHGSQDAFIVKVDTSGPVTHFRLTTSARAVAAGTVLSVTVAALDAYDTPTSSYHGAIHFSSSDTAAVLPADYHYMADDHGIHTFAAILKTAGDQTIIATDTTDAALTDRTVITVSAAAASHFSVAAPTGTIAGAAFAVTVTALDPYDNVALRYTGAVHFSSSDTAAVLPSDYRFALGDNGTHTFSGVLLKTAGTKTITATDTTTGTIRGGAAVMVHAAAANHLSVAAPVGTIAGVLFGITVTALDPYDNVAPQYTGTVRFSSTDTAATLPADYRFILGDNGIHTFTRVLLTTAGTKTITATDTITGTISGSAIVMVSAAAASHFSVAAPAGTTAGAAFAVTVTALDPYGNVAPRYTGTVHFSSSDTAATLPADYRFTAADAGVHTFAGVLLKTAGNKTITATDTTTGTISGGAAVMVHAAAANHLSVAAPAATTAGAMFGITVTALDPYDNVAPQYTGIVHFSSSDATAVLPDNYPFTTTDAGVHTFGRLILTKAGRQTVTATDTASLMGLTVGVTVASAAATALQVGGFPTPVAAGTPGTGAVTAVDAFGNISTGYRGAVHFTSSDPRSQLPADYTFTAADNGTYPFTAIFITPGRQSLTAAALANPNLRGEQTGITVTGDSVVGNISTHTVLGPLHPVKLGRSVTFTATVTATSSGTNSPSGNVTFYDATTLLGAPVPLVNGTATLTVATLGLGRHTITAHFTGTGDFQGSVSAPGIQLVHNAAFAAVGGSNGRVQVRRTSDNSLVFDFIPYPGYTGPVNVAFGDITGDGFDDLITGAGVGNPHVKVYNGAALANGTFNAINPDASLAASFFAYGLNFNVGATVAAGDIEGNGYADLVTGASAGNPQVKIYRGQDIAQGHFQPDGASQVASFFAYGLQFNVGVNVAVGDVTGDGHADLVTGASVGNPHIKVYDGQAFAAGTFNSAHPDTSVRAQWFAFGLQFNIGATVAVGDIAGNGFGDVITGAATGNPQVKVYDGQAIVEGSLTMATAEAHILDQFYAAALNQNLGVTVGASDFENTGRSDILTGTTNGIPTVKVFRGSAAGINPPTVFEETLVGFPNGISVGV